MTQFNIDTTLGSITILCSRNSPPLRPSRSGTIYLHLCRLLQAVLTHHRLKLQGHFHLVVQVMQSLLRLLFTPLPHSTARALKHFGSPPSWLSSPKHQLNAKHAAAFTRLITLTCDPSVSSVRGSQHNNLTSATDKAKRMAGQHMQFVLTTYIKLQLEMKMLSEIREKMVSGLYAIFDTMTPELRRAINDGLDANGRAVFKTLYRDYVRFGKWKGN
jgi:nucleolar pre-ribosomal-associated protein 2